MYNINIETVPQESILLDSFRLNGHTLEFCPQTQKLETPCKA